MNLIYLSPIPKFFAGSVASNLDGTVPTSASFPGTTVLMDTALTLSTAVFVRNSKFTFGCKYYANPEE